MDIHVGTDNFRGEEAQILDYQTQQEKLLPNLAAAYALLFTSNSVLQTYNRIAADVEKGNMDELQVVSHSSIYQRSG